MASSGIFWCCGESKWETTCTAHKHLWHMANPAVKSARARRCHKCAQSSRQRTQTAPVRVQRRQGERRSGQSSHAGVCPLKRELLLLLLLHLNTRDRDPSCHVSNTRLSESEPYSVSSDNQVVQTVIYRIMIWQGTTWTETRTPPRPGHYQDQDTTKTRTVYLNYLF